MKTHFNTVKKAEDFMAKEQSESSSFAEIYINRAYINTVKKAYGPAIEYLEKAIRIFDNSNETDKQKFSQNISAAYLNIGIAYYEIGNFKAASDYLNKSLYLKHKFKLKGIPLVYLNIAKTNVKTNDLLKANEFYLRSISSFIEESGLEYYRLADVYFDYGLFLRSIGNNSQALTVHRKALSICLNNYGEKHTIVSLAYKHLGDNYLIQSKLDSALYYYQKSLIAVDKSFNNPDIFSNPSIDSSLFDIRLLDNLKSKAQALELYSGSSKDPKTRLIILRKGLETIELALQLIDRIRNNYLSEESRMYLAENEKETYLFATHLAWELYSATNEKAMGERMYSIAQKAKAAILRNDITGNELLYSAGIPDSLREEQNLLSGNIAAYNNLVLDETRKTNRTAIR